MGVRHGSSGCSHDLTYPVIRKFFSLVVKLLLVTKLSLVMELLSYMKLLSYMNKFHADKISRTSRRLLKRQPASGRYLSMLSVSNSKASGFASEFALKTSRISSYTLLRI